MLKSSLAAFGLILLLCGITIGCMPRTGNRPATAPVHGRVTFQGKPVANASVCFLCPGASRLATAITDIDGNYQLTTYDHNDGAVIGTHTVTVNKLPDEPRQTPAASNDPQDRAVRDKAIELAMQQAARQLRQAERSSYSLPAKYGDHKTSDLHKEVLEGDNAIDLELVD